MYKGKNIQSLCKYYVVKDALGPHNILMVFIITNKNIFFYNHMQ